MSKKNPLEGLIEKRKAGSSAGSSNFPMMGAGRSIMGSIDELTKQASLATSGDTIVEIPTADVDPSFIQDRLDDGVEQCERWSRLEHLSYRFLPVADKDSELTPNVD